MPEIQEFAPPQPVRRRLPDERKAIVHHFNVGGSEGYLTVGFYDDGRPGEMFVATAKEGSTVSGLMDCFATAVSLALQYGVPLKVLCDKFSHTRFEPSGWSGNAEIGYAKSLMDYIFRWLGNKFLPPISPAPTGAEAQAGASAPASLGKDGSGADQADPPVCKERGAIMVRGESSHRCATCGSTGGA